MKLRGYIVPSDFIVHGWPPFLTGGCYSLKRFTYLLALTKEYSQAGQSFFVLRPHISHHALDDGFIPPPGRHPDADCSPVISIGCFFILNFYI